MEKEISHQLTRVRQGRVEIGSKGEKRNFGEMNSRHEDLKIVTDWGPQGFSRGGETGGSLLSPQGALGEKTRSNLALAGERTPRRRDPSNREEVRIGGRERGVGQG